MSESAGIDTILCGDPYRSLWGSLISLIISSRRKILHTRHTQDCYKDTHKIVTNGAKYDATKQVRAQYPAVGRARWKGWQDKLELDNEIS